MSLFQSRKKEPQKVSGFGVPEAYHSKYKLVAWFKNYWYYYRTPFIFIGIALILVIWFSVDMITHEDPDARFYIVSDTLLVEDQYNTIPDTLTPYLSDLNEDGKVKVSVSYLNLVEEAEDEIQTYAYQQVITVFYDETISLMLVDDYTYQYLAQSEGLAPLETYGVTGGLDEYRIPIRGTSLGSDTMIDLMDSEFYLVFRVCPESFDGDETVQNLYAEMAVYAQTIADEYQTQLAENG